MKQRRATCAMIFAAAFLAIIAGCMKASSEKSAPRADKAKDAAGATDDGASAGDPSAPLKGGGWNQPAGEIVPVPALELAARETAREAVREIAGKPGVTGCHLERIAVAKSGKRARAFIRVDGRLEVDGAVVVEDGVLVLELARRAGTTTFDTKGFTDSAGKAVPLRLQMLKR